MPGLVRAVAAGAAALVLHVASGGVAATAPTAPAPPAVSTRAVPPLGAPGLRAAGGIGGGGGGVSGGAIWAETWWAGTPLGPGPYLGGSTGGAGVCTWLDLGPTLADVDGGLAQASLPTAFWTVPQSGGHAGIWGVDEWAARLVSRGSRTDHFDLVACPHAAEVPPSGGDIESSLPAASPPSGGPRFLWLFWDTVPDPPSKGLPPIVREAFAQAGLPAPSVFTSPSSIDGVSDTTVVNFPTWLWVGAGIWHRVVATAEGGGYVATVWADPQSVEWRAAWDLTSPSSDPEGGVNTAPERLDERCEGPGTPYDLAVPAAEQGSSCTFDFAQSTFGTRQRLSATVTWEVHWALSSPAGIVGGEGSLGTTTTIGAEQLRVAQIESVISSG